VGRATAARTERPDDVDERLGKRRRLTRLTGGLDVLAVLGLGPRRLGRREGGHGRDGLLDGGSAGAPGPQRRQQGVRAGPRRHLAVPVGDGGHGRWTRHWCGPRNSATPGGRQRGRRPRGRFVRLAQLQLRLPRLPLYQTDWLADDPLAPCSSARDLSPAGRFLLVLVLVLAPVLVLVCRPSVLVVLVLLVLVLVCRPSVLVVLVLLVLAPVPVLVLLGRVRVLLVLAVVLLGRVRVLLVLAVVLVLVLVLVVLVLVLVVLVLVLVVLVVLVVRVRSAVARSICAPKIRVHLVLPISHQELPTLSPVIDNVTWGSSGLGKRPPAYAAPRRMRPRRMRPPAYAA